MMTYGVERDEPIRRGGARPRGIMERLSRDVQPTATTLDEAGPESNTDPDAAGQLPRAAGSVLRVGADPVEATEAYPGGPAVVEVPGEVAGHTDDDSHVRVGVDEDGERRAELVEVEPVQPLDDGLGDGRGDGRPAGSLPEPEGGEVSATGAAPDEESAAGSPGGSTARAGTPGTIGPELNPRPSTLLELADAVQPEPREAWPAGSFVLYGSGKRAHWNGEAWRSGEAPGGS